MEFKIAAESEKKKKATVPKKVIRSQEMSGSYK